MLKSKKVTKKRGRKNTKFENARKLERKRKIEK